MDDLRHGDAFDLVDEIPEDSVDVLATDPPYNISTDFELSRTEDGRYAGKDQSHNFGEWDKENITVEDWLPLFEPCLTDTAVILIMYDYFKLTDVVDTVESLGWEPRQPFVWHKQNPIPQGHAVKWQDAVELGVLATVNEGQGHNYQKSQGQRHNVVETPLCSGNERYDHPTQKPEELFEPFLQWWSEPGDVVLDPFMGTGTVPAVAQKMNRHYIGFERDDEFFSIADERLADGEVCPKMESTETYEEQSFSDW